MNPYFVVQDDDVSSKHVYAGDMRVTTTLVNEDVRQCQTPSPLFFFHTDHVQSTEYLTDRQANVFEHNEYFASGETWIDERKDQDNQGRQDYLFTGKELDAGTGVYYFGARYYDPKQSQWLNPDPILSSYMLGNVNGGVYLPNHLGLYGYGLNNPLRYRDRTGRAEGDLADVAVSFIPVIGPLRDFGRDVKKGNWGWATIDAGFAVLDVFTLGEGELEHAGAVGIRKTAEAGAKAAEAARLAEAAKAAELARQAKAAELAKAAVEKTAKALEEAKAAEAAKVAEEAKAAKATKKPPKETGSYTNTHESGKTYDGKGDRGRSQDSGKRVEKETGDPHVATDWTPAENDREAFKQESRRLDSHGGPKDPGNYNKIESPGKKMRQQDGN